jgi:hypothetical protein
MHSVASGSFGVRARQAEVWPPKKNYTKDSIDFVERPKTVAALTPPPHFHHFLLNEI